MSSSKYKAFVGIMASEGYTSADGCAMLVFPAGDVKYHEVYRPHMVEANNLRQLRDAIIKEIDDRLTISISGYDKYSGVVSANTAPAKPITVSDVSMDCLTIECDKPQASDGNDTLFDLSKV